MTLVPFLMAYAVIGTVVTMFFGKRLINLKFQQLRQVAGRRENAILTGDPFIVIN